MTTENSIEARKEYCLNKRDQSIFKGRSSSRCIIRIIAYCRRFVSNCKNRSLLRTDSITAIEVDEALHILAKMTQQELFPEEIKDIAMDKHNYVRIKKLIPFNPFIDDKDILRLRGRLRNSNFDNDKKHPMILSAFIHEMNDFYRRI